MVTKSDIAILLISFSVLLMGLYRTFDSEINERLNLSHWHSVLKNSMNSVLGSAQKGPAQEVKFAESDFQRPAIRKAEVELSNAAISVAAKPMLPVAAATGSKQENTNTTYVQAIANTAPSSVAAKEKSTIQRPGPTTVLVLSPHGSTGNSGTKASAETQNLAKTDSFTEPSTSLSATESPLSFYDLNDNESSGDNTVLSESEQPSLPTTELVTENRPVRIYEVKSGENLTIIAAKLGTTVTRLKQMNRLASSRILAGQNLIYEN